MTHLFPSDPRLQNNKDYVIALLFALQHQISMLKHSQMYRNKELIRQMRIQTRHSMWKVIFSRLGNLLITKDTRGVTYMLTNVIYNKVIIIF